MGRAVSITPPLFSPEPGKPMSSFYSITPLSGQMQVTNSHGEMTFTVANNTDKILQTRFDLGLGVPSPAKKEWLQVDTKPCNIPPKGTVQVVVKLNAPAGTVGAYNFAIVAAAAPRTDEDYTVGPTVNFSLSKAAAPAPPPFKLAWWMILIAVVVVLAIAGGIVALVMRGHGVPDVVSKKSDEAQQILQKAGFTPKVNEAYFPGKDAGIVQDQKPTKDDPAPADKVVVLNVSSAFAFVPCVEGLAVFDAVSKLKSAGLQLGDQTFTTDGSAPNNSVVSQNPRNEVCTAHSNGLRVAPGTKVNLVIKR